MTKERQPRNLIFEFILIAKRILADCQAFQEVRTTLNISVRLTETLSSDVLSTEKLLSFLKSTHLFNTFCKY